MKTDKNKICKNCEVYCPYKASHRGQCRFNPPDVDGNFPLVMEDYWCGKFKEKRDENNNQK